MRRRRRDVSTTAAATRCRPVGPLQRHGGTDRGAVRARRCAAPRRSARNAACTNWSDPGVAPRWRRSCRGGRPGSPITSRPSDTVIGGGLGARAGRGGRLNTTVPDGARSVLRLGVTVRPMVRSSSNARPPTSRMPAAHGAEPSTAIPSIRAACSSAVTTAVPSLSIEISKAILSTWAISRSAALIRRPGPIRYTPGPSAWRAPAPHPATCTSSSTVSCGAARVGGPRSMIDPVIIPESWIVAVVRTGRPSTSAVGGDALPVTRSTMSARAVTSPTRAIVISASPWAVRITTSIRCRGYDAACQVGLFMWYEAAVGGEGTRSMTW